MLATTENILSALSTEQPFGSYSFLAFGWLSSTIWPKLGTGSPDMGDGRSNNFIAWAMDELLL